ncbi:MAG: WhiB family transcriptional regulator [Candidatus Nanopelagicales bacterium]|jgi:WhiB family redox-sensing transcriptional regulator
MADISRLPGPNADIWDWQLIGLCRGEDPNVFFHPEGERGPARVNRDAAAKAICGACPVRLQCAQHALAVKEPYGVWGGLTEDDREAIYAGRLASNAALDGEIIAAPAVSQVQIATAS